MEGIKLLCRKCHSPIMRDRQGIFICTSCAKIAPPEVFISYHGGGGNERRSSYPKALELKKYFEDRGIPAFVCRAERRSDFKRAISDALRDANHFVLVARDEELFAASGWIIDDEIDKFDAYIKNSRNPGELIKKPKEAVMTAYLYGGFTREKLTYYADAFLTRDIITEGQGSFESVYLMISRAILDTKRRELAELGEEDGGDTFTTVNLKQSDRRKIKEIKKSGESGTSLLSFQRLESGGYSVCLSDITAPKGNKFKIDIPEKYCSEPVVEIADKAFAGKRFISAVNIPRSVKKIGAHAFSGCESLREINLPEGLCEFGTGALAECLSLETVSLPESLAAIPDKLFCGCVNLREVALPSLLTEVGRDAFKGCSSLSHSVYSGGRYLGNSRNPHLLLTKFTGKKGYCVHPLTRIIGDRAFSELPLSKITLPRGVVSIGFSAFCDCARLKEVIFEGASLKIIGAYAFCRCVKLESIKLPEGTSEIKESAFAHCEALSELNIPLGLREISKECFAGTAVSTVRLHGNIRRIANSAFDSARVREVVMEEGVEAISNCAFSYCACLSSVVLPRSVKLIERYAFLGCQSVAIYYKGSKEELMSTSVGEGVTLKEERFLTDSLDFNFYSGQKPAVNGSFWHMSDGKVKEW